MNADDKGAAILLILGAAGLQVDCFEQVETKDLESVLKAIGEFS